MLDEFIPLDEWNQGYRSNATNYTLKAMRVILIVHMKGTILFNVVFLLNIFCIISV